MVLYSLVKFVDLLSILMNDSIWIRNDALSLDPGLRELVIYCLVHVVGVSSSYELKRLLLVENRLDVILATYAISSCVRHYQVIHSHCLPGLAQILLRIRQIKIYRNVGGICTR